MTRAKKRTKGKPRGRAGRRPTGLRPGERLVDYQQLTVRLPPSTLEALRSLSKRMERPQWRVMSDAIEALAAGRERSSKPPEDAQQAAHVEHPADREPMKPLPGSTFWLESGPEIVHDDVETATLIVRLGLAVNALRAQKSFTTQNTTAEIGAGRMRDSVWSFLTAAAYTGEALNILTGTGRVQGRQAEIVSLAQRGGAEPSKLRMLAQVAGGSHPARAIVTHVRNCLGFHWDPAVIRASLDQYHNPALIWVEGKNGTNGETVHRLAVEVLANAIAPLTGSAPIDSDERYKRALGHVLEAMKVIEHVFEHAIIGYFRQHRSAIRTGGTRQTAEAVGSPSA